MGRLAALLQRGIDLWRGRAPEVEAVIGLGSNVGNRRLYLKGAVAALGRLGRVVAVSSLYETAPVGGPAQGDYLNAVAVLATARSPREVLEGLLDIERSAGRERRERWGPRTLDLDLLLYGRSQVAEPGLKVPHPGLGERRFVLVPLLEVRPDAALPGGEPLAARLPGVAGQELALVAPPGWER